MEFINMRLSSFQQFITHNKSSLNIYFTVPILGAAATELDVEENCLPV